MFIEKMKFWAVREGPKKHTKMKLENENDRTIQKYKNVRKIKDYDYYICDFCNQEIKITDKWEEKDGGIVEIPFNIFNKNKILLALHNKCLNPLMNKIRDEEMIQNNMNHITH